ncbi:MAG TPA: BatA and WFA domain-containing protein [Candidatus Acidoferrales bacterium]|nr:BatA and WFA domain-containing protein [Candidatus Acidoferrales bacterium]
MSFLSPELFAVLIPLAALPLILHLLNQGFPRQFNFPSIELIKATMARRSKLHRWRHWILLLLRTLFLLLLLLAFLQPVLKRFGANPADQSGRQVLIVLDHSLSMEDKGDGPSSRERAVHEAAKLMDSLGAEDTVNILLAEPALTTCFVAFSKDMAGAKRFLNQVKPGLNRADINLANTAAARLIGQGAARSEIYYLSDFTRKKWANASFKMLPPATKLFFVDVGPARRDNRAILDARPVQTQMLAGDTVPLEVSVGNFSETPFAGRVTVMLDRKYSFDQEISLAAWSVEKITVPVSVGGPGVHLCEVRLPPDALEYDNQFFLTLSVLEKEEVLIVTDNSDQRKSGAYYLKMALNPYENESGSLLPRIITSSEISSARLAGVQKVFFTQVNRLSPEASATAAKFLFQGGGLIYFLDGPSDAENLAALEKITGPGTMPLRLARRNEATNVAAGAQQIVRGDFKSPYLKLFEGNTRQDLALLEFYDYYQAGATSAGGVLLEYGDGSPAMASLHHGLGTLLLLNFSAGEFSSNLSRQRIFPAWMQDLVKAISTAEPPPSAYTVDESIQAEVWRSEMRDEVVGPGGAVANTRRELSGERCRLEFTPDQLGFYTVGAPHLAYAFGVNPALDQSDLRPIDKNLLPSEFSDNHEAHLVAGAEDYDAVAHGRPIFHWLVFGALACLLLENGFQWLVRRKPA